MLLTGMVGNLVSLLLNAVSLVVFVYAILSWIPNVDRNNAVIKLIVGIAEPICAPVRKLVPPKATGNIDLSPIIVILAINVLQMIL